MNKKLYIILTILFALTPLGLLSSYSAWGEWDNEVYQKLIGFIPKGIENASSINPLIPDYGEGSVVMYYLSALIGGGLIFGIFYLLSRSKK